MSRTYRNRAYITWHNLMSRSERPGYEGVTICDEWMEFETFEIWYEENYIEGYDLDKDLKSPGNTHYSPENCLFIPGTLNRKLAKLDCCGIYFHSGSGSWRAQGLGSSGNRGVIKQSKNLDECLKAYSIHLKHRLSRLADEYPEYAIYISGLLEYVV